MADKDLYKSISTTRLSEQVSEQIESLIISGQLKQGDRLPPERELSERFGVSRTVIREAVRALQEKGLLEIRSGVGTFVHNGMSEIMRQSLGRMVSIDKKRGMTNLMQVREILEPEIASIAAEKATPTDVNAMQVAIDTMESSIDDVETFITGDQDFHLALARATQNQLIVELIDSVVELLGEQRRQIFLAGVNGPSRGQKHHRRILAAVKAHDKEQARRCMIEHLIQIRDDSRLYNELLG